MNIGLSGKKWTAFALLLVVIFLIYSHSFRAAWHFDDYPNIINNPFIKITDLNLSTLKHTFFASRDGGLYLGKHVYRPVACLTLALNWYFGKDEVFGYHLVNISIHFLTSFILFLTLFSLFQTPGLRDKYAGNEYFLALLAAVLWAVHPIQTQAVTYIVQRMASLAALFYLLSFYLYLKGRLSEVRIKKFFLYPGCVVSYLLAIGSKENAVTLPIAVILLELVFFQDLSRPKIRKAFFWGTITCGIFIVALGLLFFCLGRFSPISSRYNSLSFTPWQRLLTEPRIIIFYLVQIFYAAPSLLSITHEIDISTSLFQPWTTLPAILIIFLLAATGILLMRKNPVLSFGILFFFLNHLIESTVLPLELIFEHRNYLPSLFLFLPVALGIKKALDYYQPRKRPMYLIFVTATTLLIIGLGIGTYIRNLAWATEKTLWEDAMTKAPGQARPYQNLAWGYYEKEGKYEQALNLYEKALHLKDTNPTFAKILSLTNMAVIYHKKQEYEKAIQLCHHALDVYPNFIPALKVLTFALLKTGKWGDASQSAALLLSKHHTNTNFMFMLSFSLLKAGKYEEALHYLRKAVSKEPNNATILYNIGVAMSLSGKYERADWFLKRAGQLAPKDIFTSFYLVENSLKAGDQAGADRYLEHLFRTHRIQEIATYAKGLPEDALKVSFSPDLLAPLIAKKIEAKTRDIKTLADPRADDVRLGRKNSTSNIQVRQ